MRAGSLPNNFIAKILRSDNRIEDNFQIVASRRITVQIQAGGGFHYATNFTISAWQDRPEVFGPRTVPAPTAVNGAAPVHHAPPANHVPPPAAKPAAPVVPQRQEMADADEMPF